MYMYLTVQYLLCLCIVFNFIDRTLKDARGSCQLGQLSRPGTREGFYKNMKKNLSLRSPNFSFLGF